MITLMITIIVIIILAAAVILSISSNNPIGNAREARFKEDIRNIQDELSMYISSKYTKNLVGFDPSTENLSGGDMVKVLPTTNGYEDILEVKKGKLVYKGEDKNEIEYFKTVLGDAGLVILPVPEDWQATIEAVTEDKVPIPKGFTYVEGTKTTGTVIKDSNNNEFVWIPATPTSYVKDLNFPGPLPTEDDTLPNGISDETSDVLKYGGFYIARYEAGIPNGDTAPSNKVGIPVSKKRTIAWTNIDYINAKASAESMISNEYVQTGLLTGKAWDRTCHFIEDYIKTLNKESSLSNSMYYGNHYDSTFKYINSSNQEVEKITNSDVIILTGSTEYTKTKNIYDLAGNVWEWESEKINLNSVVRGGHSAVDAASFAVSCRFSNGTEYSSDYIGFRTRLYIK